MTTYLVFGTYDEANAAERVIFRRGAYIAKSVGYELSEDGFILGERDGEPDPIGVSKTWDIPRQRVDGLWVIAHPREHPAAENATWLAFVMRGIDAPTEENGAGW